MVDPHTLDTLLTLAGTAFCLGGGAVAVRLLPWSDEELHLAERAARRAGRAVARRARGLMPRTVIAAAPSRAGAA